MKDKLLFNSRGDSYIHFRVSALDSPLPWTEIFSLGEEISYFMLLGPEDLRPMGLDMGTYLMNSRSSTCRGMTNLWYVGRKSGTKKGLPSYREGTRFFTNFTTVSALMYESLWGS